MSKDFKHKEMLSNLDSCFCEFVFVGKFLSGEDVGVVGSRKDLF